MDSQLDWLKRLEKSIPDLRQQHAPPPYWSQKNTKPETPGADSLVSSIRRVKQVIASFDKECWFAQTLGFDCIDDRSGPETTIEDEFDRRVGKANLLTLPEEQWSADDLCDVVEVYHDLAARPTRGYYHTYYNCGFHPTRYSIRSGQQIYRWRMNTVLETSSLNVRLAEQGEDVGRLIRGFSSELDELVNEISEDMASSEPEVPHAIAMFRRRDATREDRRLAVVELARVLEDRRQLLKRHLPKKDEGALFKIANEFDLRHRNGKQMPDYGDEYLDWIAHWYLATIKLVETIDQDSPKSDSAQEPG